MPFLWIYIPLTFSNGMQTHAHITWCQCKMQMLSTDTPQIANIESNIPYTQCARCSVLFFYAILCTITFPWFSYLVWQFGCHIPEGIAVNFHSASTSFRLTMTHIQLWSYIIGRIMFVCDIANRIICFDIYFTTKHRLTRVVFMLNVLNVCRLLLSHSIWHSMRWQLLKWIFNIMCVHFWANCGCDTLSLLVRMQANVLERARTRMKTTKTKMQTNSLHTCVNNCKRWK